ncbi:MAG: DUF1573 domain-containing protein [Planctomycetota bacterium]
MPTTPFAFGYGEGDFSIIAYHWRMPITTADYQAAIEYAVELGSKDENAARLEWGMIPFMDLKGVRHTRASRLLMRGDRLACVTSEATNKGTPYQGLFWRNGNEAASTTSLFRSDQTIKSPLERWRSTGNGFHDLPTTVAQTLKVFADAHYLLSLVEGHPDPGDEVELKLTPEVLQQLGADGHVGSVTYAGASAKLEWSNDSQGLRLYIRWLDSRGNGLGSYAISWPIGQERAVGPPSRIVIEDELPTLAGIMSRSVYTIARRGHSALPEDERLTIPLERGSIRDRRFGALVTYSAEQLGALDDAMIAQRADGQAMREIIGKTVIREGHESLARIEDSLRTSEADDWLAWRSGALRVGVAPATWRAVPLEIGRDAPFVFEIHNEGTEELKVDGIDVDCGCISFELSSYSIPPHSVAALRGVYEVRQVGTAVRHVSLRFAEGGSLRTLALPIAITGVPAVFSAEPSYDAGTHIVGEPTTAQVYYLTAGCATAEQPPRLECLDDSTEYTVTWSFEDGVATGQLSRIARGDVRLGAYADIIRVTGPLCPDAPGSLAVVFGTVAPDMNDEWPSCIILAATSEKGVGSLGTATASLTLPVAVSSCRSVHAIGEKVTVASTSENRSIVTISGIPLSTRSQLLEFELVTAAGSAMFMVCVPAAR